MKKKHIGTSSIKLEEKKLEITAGKFNRFWDISEGCLRTTSIKTGHHDFEFSTDDNHVPECIYDGLIRVPRRMDSCFPPLELTETTLVEVPASSLNSQHLHLGMHWEEPIQEVKLHREWMVYPDIDAMVTRGGIQSQARPQFEIADEWQTEIFNIIDTIPIKLNDFKAIAVSFYGRTDNHNNFLEENEFQISSDTESILLSCNLLFIEKQSGEGLFFLHESPPENERRPECDGTFLVSSKGIKIMNWGIAPHEILSDSMRYSYYVAMGSYEGGFLGRMEALRKFQKVHYPLAELDKTIVANPWGDGNCYAKFNENFLLDEICAAAEIGATHYQIDDGWQKGSFFDMVRNNLARPTSFWDIHTDRFPDGLDVLARKASEKKIGLALWFAPDTTREYRNWMEDKRILWEMFERHGMALFKIDGVRVRSKAAEDNLQNLLKSLIKDSEDKIRFNLDITNGTRFGYFLSQRFGSVFVENRYVQIDDQENAYYPWRVLQNLWVLSKYIPPEKLQFECVNFIQKNVNAIFKETPAKYSWEYIAAIPLMAAPLCWLQPSELLEESRIKLRRLMNLHLDILPELETNFTFPIGEKPDGRSWTGFWSYHPDNPSAGLIQIFRENNDRPAHAFAFNKMRIAPNSNIILKCLNNSFLDRSVRTDSQGNIVFTLEDENSFAIYRYEVIK